MVFWTPVRIWSISTVLNPCNLPRYVCFLADPSPSVRTSFMNGAHPACLPISIMQSSSPSLPFPFADASPYRAPVAQFPWQNEIHLEILTRQPPREISPSFPLCATKRKGRVLNGVSYRVAHLVGNNLPLTWILDIPPSCLPRRPKAQFQKRLMLISYKFDQN